MMPSASPPDAETAREPGQSGQSREPEAEPPTRQSGMHSAFVPSAVLLSALSQIDQGVWVCDSERHSVWQNARMAAFERELSEGGALQLLRDPSWAPRDAHFELADGGSVSVKVTPLELAEAQAGHLFLLRDDSQRVRLEHALEDSEGRLRLLSAHAEGILFELDADARFVRVWTSDPALLARPEPELLGHTLIEVLGPTVGAWHHEKVCTTLRTGLDQEYEYELEVPSGRRHFACSAVAVPGVNGSRAAIFWIRDTTEELTLRAKLLHAERLASIGVLAAGVAHEINNPLAYMLLNLEHIESVVATEATPAQRERLGTPLRMVREGMQRVRRIVADLLNLSKSDQRTELVDLHHALDVSIDAASPEIGSRARLSKQYGSPPAVDGDESRLIQVFTNLLLNAAQAIGESDPEQQAISVSTFADPDGSAHVEIRDTGRGIPQDMLANVFEPFFTTKTSGTGLGLAICQRIVSSFGGQITIESREREGTCVHVILPAAKSPSAAPQEPVR